MAKKNPHKFVGVFHVSHFFLLSYFCLFCLSFSSLPLLFDILKPKICPPDEVFGILIYILAFGENVINSETGRMRFWRARFRTPNLVSFFALTEFLGENSVSSSQPSIRVQKANSPSFPQNSPSLPQNSARLCETISAVA